MVFRFSPFGANPTLLFETMQISKDVLQVNQGALYPALPNVPTGSLTCFS
jgi:hypothetical protein